MFSKKRIIATIMTAALVVTSVPAIQADAAQQKYKYQYTKSIVMEEPEEVPEETPAADTGSSQPTVDPTTGATTDPAATGAVEEPEEPEIPGEMVKVMEGMKFMISTTRYGKLIDVKKNKSNFKYKSTNKKIATVNSKGVVTTKKKGKCDIIVTNKKDKNQYAIHLNVVSTVKVKSIKLNATSKTFKKLNKKFTLQAKINTSTKNAGDIPVFWFTTDTNVATVDRYGNVKITGYGNCKIACMAGSDNMKGICDIKVVNPNSQNYEGGGGNAGADFNAPNYSTGKVVDISHHNSVVDWGQLRQSCDAVIIRLGYRGYGSGALMEDSQFRSNVYNCIQYGIPYSFYFYTTAENESEAREEANFIANRVGGQTLCFPIFIDTESNPGGRANGLSRSDRTDCVGAACRQLNGRGLGAGVYASLYWLNNNLDMSELPFSVWVAHYSTSCGYSGSKLLWQYTSSASGYGVRTGGADRCDVSYWYD
jgi:GH25 family lysozyme M1 (1,4-beta-N-acetylmuramidase)